MRGGGRRGRQHRAPLDLLEVQWLGSVLDDDGVGANHFGGGAAARLDSQHLEPLPRPCRSVGTRGYGDRHIGIGESEQRTSAGRVKVEQLTARALDATETIIHWSEGRAATQPWPVPLQKHRVAERLAWGWGASLAAHQCEIKVEDDKRGQEDGRPQQHLAHTRRQESARGKLQASTRGTMGGMMLFWTEGSERVTEERRTR